MVGRFDVHGQLSAIGITTGFQYLTAQLGFFIKFGPQIMLQFDIDKRLIKLLL